MRISHNITALNTYRQYNTNSINTNKSMEKLSSGSRINRAADDAAGLSISEKMRSQIRGLTQATRNAQDGISFIQTAEGALNEVSDMLTRIKELATQVTNGTYSADDQANIGAEMKALGEAITNIYVNTKFNGKAVFGEQTKSTAGTTTVTTGYKNTSDDTEISIEAYNLLTEAEQADYEAITEEITTQGGVLEGKDGNGDAAKITYGEDGGQSVVIKQAKTVNLSTLIAKTAGGTAESALSVLDSDIENAITEVNTTRAKYGAQQNQLEHASNNMATTKENLQAAESRVRDVDMAEEMMSYTKNNILLQAAQAMLAQANAQPQGVLQLLQ